MQAQVAGRSLFYFSEAGFYRNESMLILRSSFCGSSRGTCLLTYITMALLASIFKLSFSDISSF